MTTRNARASALGFALAALVVLPAPDAAVTIRDRQQVAGAYAGILSGSESPAPTVILVSGETYAAPTASGSAYEAPSVSGVSYRASTLSAEAYASPSVSGGAYASPSTSDHAYVPDEAD